MTSIYKKKFQFTCAMMLTLGSVAYGQDPTPSEKPGEDLTNLNLDDLMNVKVTTASKKAESLFGVPAAIFVISNEDIKRSGAPNIPEALRLAPGLSVLRVDAQRYAVSIRGFNDVYASRLLVLVDGRSVYNAFFGGVYWEDQSYNLDDIERIEVIRGPGGSNWGANAVNGIINIITKSSKDTQGVTVNLQGGTEVNESTASIRYGGKLANGAFRLTALGLQRGNSETASGREQDDWAGGRLSFRWDGGSENTKVLVTGDYHKFDLQRTGTVLSATAPNYGSVTGYAASQGGHLLARLESSEKSGASTWLQAFYDMEDRGFSAVQRSKVATIDLDFQRGLAPIGAHNVSLGLGYRTTSDLYVGQSLLSSSQDTFAVYSAFAQDTFALDAKTKLVLGVKAMHNDFTGWEFQPSAKLSREITDHEAAWFSVGRAVTVPTRSTVDLNAFAGTVPLGGGATGELRLFGDANAPAGVLVATEAGYRKRVNSKLSVDLSSFYNQYDHVYGFQAGSPFVSTDPFTRVIIPTSVFDAGKAHTYGFEASGRYQATDRWKVDFAYGFIDGEAPAGAIALNLCKHTFQALSSVQLSSKLTFDQQLVVVGANADSTASAFAFANLQLRYKANSGLDFSVGGRNLGSKRHSQAGVLGFDSGSYVYPELYATATWKF